MWISPNHQDTKFSRPLSIDDRITIFLDRVEGWQLDIADQCINEISHSGFAVLHIILSYFEMIAKYRDGFDKKGESEEYFKQGVYSVFPELETSPQTVNSLEDVLYSGGRCALYHSSITDPRILLSDGYEFPMAFDDQNQLLKINPRLLVQKLKNNLEDYGEQLRDINNSKLRENFGKRFDFDTPFL